MTLIALGQHSVSSVRSVYPLPRGKKVKAEEEKGEQYGSSIPRDQVDLINFRTEWTGCVMR